MICPELPYAKRSVSMAPTARQIQSLRDLGLIIDVVEMRGIPKLKYLKALPRILSLPRGIDLIHAHFGYCGWLGLAALLSGSKIPLVISFMGNDLLGSPYNPNGDLTWSSKLMVHANKVLARQAAQVIVKSQQMADVLAPLPSTVIANGVDITTFRPMDREGARKRLSLPAERKLVLFPGNPNDPRKGYQLAAEAIDVASRRLGERIEVMHLWGVEPQLAPVYMNACDVMMMTSLIEGSPNVVKEAMACNTPVVAVSVGDIQEMLHGIQGSEVCPRDPCAIGAALLRALDGPCDTSRDAILGRGLDLESVARRVVDIYEEALQRTIPLPRDLPKDALV
jgi:glycosyltransferase involved in cell wall biosynthesis